VTERYLEYIRSISDEETSVSSLLLEAPGPGGREEDLHEFLVSMLRQNDLLFPIGRFRWRLLLHANKMEREYYLLRLQREIAAADRHSPPRRLPELNVPSIETWKISPSREHRYEPSVLDALSHSNLLTATDRRNAEKRNSCLDHHFGEAFRPKPSDPSR
jgi:hypothetical protein